MLQGSSLPLAVVLLIAVVSQCWGLREQKAMSWASPSHDATSAGTLPIVSDDYWGFESGGKIEFSCVYTDPNGVSSPTTSPTTSDVSPTSSSGPPVFFLTLFSETQWSAMRDAKYDPVDLQCLEPSVMRIEIITSGRCAVNVTVPRQGNFVVAVQMCSSNPATLHVDLTLWNPIGTHLSVQQQPLVDVYSVFMILYGFVVWQWLILLVQHRSITIKIHWCLLAVVVLKLVEMTSNYVQMGILRRDGDVKPEMYIYVRGMVAIAEISVIIVEMMICMTWTVYRYTYTTHEYYVSVLAALCFIVFRCLYAFCAESSVLCSLYLISYFVVKFLIEFGLLVALTQNIELLKREIFVDDTATVDSLKTLQRLRHIRLVYGVSIITPFVLVFIRFSVLTWRNEWVTTVMDEGVVWMCFVFIGAILR
eukprot:PhF_6_TR1444/c0_g1_i1/m.2565